MAILGSIISRSIQLRNKLSRSVGTPNSYQQRTLRTLLEKAQYTSFGKQYGFEHILSNSLDIRQCFKKNVPIHTYNSIFEEWWYRCMEGEENVCWPGKVRYFALSSGTSESASKHIPVTNDMVKQVKKVGFKQFYSMTNFPIPKETYSKGVLMLGGTTSLFDRGDYYEGDMSGISAKNMPRIISNLLYKPGQKISKMPEWDERIRMIVANAPKWDVGTLCGVPAWGQIVLDQIINTYGLKSIHDIWPNLAVYIHGGVAFEPYKNTFARFFSKPVNFIETYMASEGSFGFQTRPNAGIRLVLNVDIFFEFIPFDRYNFDEDGNLKENSQTFFIDEVGVGTEYAVILSTCAGAWRYLIGDVIKFTDVANHEIVITGRTKQFLSLCGEHISVDNLNKTVEILNEQLNSDFKEFTVVGVPHEGLFAHRWYLAANDGSIDIQKAKQIIDSTLCNLNDDYAVERTSALKEVFVEVLPHQVFIDYMKVTGKFGAMNKFPRVMKGTQASHWLEYLEHRKISI